MNISAGTIRVGEDKARVCKFLSVSRVAHGFVAHESRPGREGLQLWPPCGPIVVEAAGLRVGLNHREVYVDGLSVHLSKTGLRPAAFLDNLPQESYCRSADSARSAGPERQSETHYLPVLAGQLRHSVDDAPHHHGLSSP